MARKHNTVHARSVSQYKARKAARGFSDERNPVMPDLSTLRRKQGVKNVDPDV